MDHHLLGIGWQLLMALSSGLLIGIERQSNRAAGQKHLGIRDFTLIALLAFIASYLQAYNSYIWPVAFSGVMVLGVVVFVFESLGALHQEGPTSRAGITTILSFPIVFLIASLSVFHVEFWLMATIVFILLIILELKDQWHQFASTIEKHELLDFSILIAIALVITPLIPSDAAIKVPLYSFAQHMFSFQSVNVATFWKVLLMVSFMSFIAHFITKYIRGRNALLLATFFGGLVSSLATIILFLRGSIGKKDGQENLYLAYLAASTGSLFKDILILFAIVPQAFFQKMLFPIVSIFLVMVVLTLVNFSKSTQTEEVRFTDRPLPFKFITKFSTVFSIVMILMVFVRFYLGHAWLIIATFLSSLISSAAALASIGEAFKYNEINDVVMGIGILLALLGSIMAKYGVILYRLGMRQSWKFLLPILAMVGIGSLTFSVTFF